MITLDASSGMVAIQPPSMSEGLSAQLAATAQSSTVSALSPDKMALSSTATASSGGGIFATIRNFFSGGKVSTTAGQVSAATTTASTGTTAATAASTAAGATSTVATSKGFGSSVKEMMNEVLPKPEPVSLSLLGKRVLYSSVFGMIGNGLKAGIYIATGKWSGGQAMQYVLRDTIKGAVGGAGFGLGMGLTTMALTPLGVAGIPLSIASIVGGSLVGLGSLQLLAQYSGWDWGYI